MDLLPPGNVPAPAVGDNRSDFPDFWQSDFWPALWPKITISYATTAARDADLAGLGPSDRATVFLEDTQTLSRWSGTAWQDLTSTKWNSFAPVLRNMSTSAVLASTTTYGKWRTVGAKTIHAKAAATITGAGSSVGIALPFTAATREFAVTAAITGSSPPAAQVGGAMSAGKDHIVVVTPTFGFCDMTAGCRISYDLTFEVA